MPTEKEKSSIIMPPPDDNFARLTRAVEAIAARATITTTVEPRPLDSSAQEAVAAYKAIAFSLRTIFEVIPTLSTSGTLSPAPLPINPQA
jgi:hypothetical protein